MRISRAAAGSLTFFLVAPTVVAGAIPWWLTRWEGRAPPYWIPLRVFGVFLIAGGLMTIVPAFLRFVVEGLGTPAPIAPTERLVVGGLYRYVRNPMYVAVTAVILGQGLLLGRAVLFVYAATIFAAFASFVHWYEEPALTRRFGSQYTAYKDAVPAWCPSLFWGGGRLRRSGRSKSSD